MKHDWVKVGPEVGTSRDKGPTDRWKCQNCGAECTWDVDSTPDPDMSFWTGKECEVVGCDDMLVHAIHSL